MLEEISNLKDSFELWSIKGDRTML